MSRWGTCIANETSKKLVQQFRYPVHVAPGEAEAECALLQKKGIVDMVMSQDGDAIMFGSQLTLRNWSKEGARGNKAPTHVNLMDLRTLKERSGLDPDGMILVALLSGGDYDQEGVAGFGATLACEVARAGFGTDLIQLVKAGDQAGLQEWRERLQYELETNESGYFKKRRKTLRIPDSFPDRTLMDYYINPAVSKDEDLANLAGNLSKTWQQDIDIPELRRYVGDTFDWQYKPGAWKFVRSIAPPFLAYNLRRGQAHRHFNSVDQIRERRQHFTNDGLPELRVEMVPAEVVGLNLDAEEDSPEFLARLAEEQEIDDDPEAAAVDEEMPAGDQEPTPSQQTQRTRKSPPWSPFSQEKMWIPETILQLGIPALVEQWQENERATLSDPKKFATRKCKKTTSQSAKVNGSSRIDQYFATSKPSFHDNGGTAEALSYRARERKESPSRADESPKKVARSQAAASIPASSPDLKDFFRNSKATTSATLSESILKSGDSEIVVRAGYATVSAQAEDLLAEVNVFNSLALAEQATVVIAPITAQIEPDCLVDRPPLTPRKAAAASLDDQDFELPSSVTRRKKRGGKPAIPSSPKQEGTPRRSRPIESFFKVVARSNESSSVMNQACGSPPKQLLPLEPSTGLKATFTAGKTYAVLRDSLPGTWKELDLDEDITSVKTRRAARVSFVDLAND